MKQYYPFYVGDKVRINTGKHKGFIGTVASFSTTWGMMVYDVELVHPEGAYVFVGKDDIEHIPPEGMTVWYNGLQYTVIKSPIKSLVTIQYGQDKDDRVQFNWLCWKDFVLFGRIELLR